MKKRASRSRNGCLRCKERRLKCDETQPACQHCQRRKVTCPGYQLAVRWSDKYEVLRANQQQQQTSDQRHAASSRSFEHVSNTVQPEKGTGSGNAPPATRKSGLLQATNAIPIESLQEASMTDHTLPPSNFAQSQSNSMMQDISNECTQFGGTFNITPPADENQITDDDFGQFALADQEFWSTLILPWVPHALDHAGETLTEQHNPLLGQGSRAASPGKELSTFNASDVTNEDTTMLLEHYFENILSINSVFDSLDNPFRYLVSGYVRSSPLVRNCVLSCSAMHLMSNGRNMHQKVVRYHSEALKCLATAMDHIEGDPPSTEQGLGSRNGTLVRSVDCLQEALLALLLLGASSSWLDPSDIGVTHLISARRLFGKWLGAVSRSSGGDIQTVMQDRNSSFIVGAMAYWEAVTSFVVDQPVSTVDYLEPFCHQPNTSMVYPNPWTGVGTPIFIVMAQVGIYVRQRRAISKLQTLGWPPNVFETMLDEILRRVEDTEMLALEYEPPIRSQVVGDQKAPLNAFSELESLAHTYKLAALLELYRSFPQLDRKYDHQSLQSIERSPTFSSLPATLDRAHRDMVGGTALDHQEHGRIIYEVAINLLNLLKDTAGHSASSLAHTLALLIGGSALHHGLAESPSSPDQDNQPARIRNKVTDMLAKLNMRPHVVELWRTFVRERLKSNADFVGLEAFRRVETLMEEIWSRLDKQSAESQLLAQTINEVSSPAPPQSSCSVHWLDVMTECRLETIFG